jgi:hypothetical protein
VWKVRLCPFGQTYAAYSRRLCARAKIRRMRTPHIVLVVVVAMTLTAAPAEAYPGEGPATARTRELTDLGVKFWRDRNVTGCPAGIVVLEADDLSDSDASGGGVAGRGGDCRLWIRRSLMRPAPKNVDGAPTRVEVCAIVVHEVGHALGLQHTPTGVMRAVAGWPDSIPWDCRQWVRRHSRLATDSRSRARTARSHLNMRQGEGSIR